jgi:oleate hydratase
MRRYLLRFINHIDGIIDFTALKFTRYNQYESMILPLESYIKSYGVKIQYDSLVINVQFTQTANVKSATAIELLEANEKKVIKLNPETDLVFITNGSCTENSTFGDNDHPAVMNTQEGPI